MTQSLCHYLTAVPTHILTNLPFDDDTEDGTDGEDGEEDVEGVTDSDAGKTNQESEGDEENAEGVIDGGQLRLNRKVQVAKMMLKVRCPGLARSGMLGQEGRLRMRVALQSVTLKVG